MQKLFYFALNRIKGLGPRTVKKWLEMGHSIDSFFEASEATLLAQGLPKHIIHAIKSFDRETLQEDIDFDNTPGQTIITWDDAHYPPLLREIHDPPLVLYAAGDLACLKLPMLAVVGTRKPSMSGKETAYRFCQQLAKYPITLVSGMASGIDGISHQGCLAGKGRTIAVMGTGMNHCYPREHRALRDKIREEGLILTEFPPSLGPMTGHFPRRNRIISGLSLATLVIEAAMKSGSLITARLALEQNRDVLAIPGSIHNPQVQGCHYLLQQGATLVTSPEDILQVLGLPLHTSPMIHPHATTSAAHPLLLSCIEFDTTPIDRIVARSNLALEQVRAGLVLLEIEGLIKALPGGYARCLPTEVSQ